MAKWVLSDLVEARKTRSLTAPEQKMFWKLSNPEKVRASERARKRKNPAVTHAKRLRNRLQRLARDPEFERRDARKWREMHPGYDDRFAVGQREAEKRYAQRHPEIRAAATRRRRARKKAAEGSHTVAETDALFVRQAGHCANPYCCVALTRENRQLDHRQALSRGGSDDISNLQWLCASCNSRKKAQDETVWLRREAERFVRDLHRAVAASTVHV